MPTLPMSYCTVEQMLTTLPEVGSISTVTSAILGHYGGRAEAEINARLGNRYVVPFTSCPPIITAIAIDLGLYYTLGRKPLVGSQSKSDPWFEKFKESREMLKELAAGTMALVDSAGQVISQRTDIAPAWSSTMNYKPTFYEGEPEYWDVDPSKIDDEMNRRG